MAEDVGGGWGGNQGATGGIILPLSKLCGGGSDFFRISPL